uniref:Cytochrome c oxidase subunit 2 n=1 Tax=Strongyloides venezuelensis TaxID=75913 RepID=A0A0P0YK11_STRVS|nr:cytochrome c oxidase subunit II [Strongyloides venezuelensis]BAT21222.1 cytochrome c oxidase subunit II [Strongyloides venezuelensis]
MSYFFNYFQGFCLPMPGNLFASYVDWFHNFNCSLLFGVLFFVSAMIVYLISNKYYLKSYKEYQLAELLCSLIPTVILVIQMVPSLSILYYQGLMANDSALTIKVTGHQWYWSYDYSDIDGLEFDSYMKPLDELKIGEPRLLEVDNRCVVPVDTNIRFCVTSADVIHSWALPSFSVKVDAMAGVLSTVNCNFPMVGVYYGQCSEICGANHSFMPIALEVTTPEAYKNWVMGNVL